MTTAATLSAAIKKFGALMVPTETESEWAEMMKRPALIAFTMESLYHARRQVTNGETPDPRVMELAEAILD